MATVGNYQCPFEFVNTGIKIECGDGEDLNFIYDPIDIGVNIEKEEVDLEWENCSVDENHDNSSDKQYDSTTGSTNTLNTVPHCTNGPLTESITNEAQTKSNDSKKFCEKYKIDQSWLEHSYNRIVHPGCENCPYKVSDKEKEDTTSANKLDSSLGIEKLNFPQYQCDFCTYQTFKRSTLHAHTLCKHLSNRSTAKTSTCQNCGERFPNVSLTYLHLFRCRLFKCDNCTYKTNIRHNMKQHIFNVHMEKNGKKISMDLKNQIFRLCSYCSKIYPSSSIQFHKLTCRKKTLNCNFCCFKTIRIGLLNTHVLTEHPKKNADNQICEKCGRIFDKKLPMRSHYFECPMTPFIKCNYCSFTTKYSLCLIKHLLRQHCNLERNIYECPKCSKKLASIIGFQKHLFDCLSSCHMQCDICSYKTLLPSNLTEHVLKRHYRRQEQCSIPCTKCGCRLDTYILWKDHVSKCE